MSVQPEVAHIHGTHIYNGIKYPNVVLDSSIDAMQTFQVRPDDVWITTYPKSGTHWLMEIVGLLHAKGIPDDINRSLQISMIEMINLDQKLPRTREEELANPPDMSPFLDVIDKAPSPRVIWSHLPLNLLPPTLVKTGKVIYVARNPKDSVTSLYNFIGNTPFIKLSWETILQCFMEDKNAWGSWPDHVKTCWNVRNEKNILFLFYESMKKEPAKYIKQVAEHIGVELAEEELEKVVEYSSFKGMKKSYEKAEKAGVLLNSPEDGHLTFMHKGVSGGWKHRFTVAESETFDKWYHENMADSDISFEYE